MSTHALSGPWGRRGFGRFEMGAESDASGRRGPGAGGPADRGPRRGRRPGPPWDAMDEGSGRPGFDGPGFGGPGFGGPGFGGPGFGGPPWARGMRGGPKVRRGDVRAAILSVLSEQSQEPQRSAGRNGYQVIQEIAERSGGAWKPSPGSVYPTLQQLEDEGLIGHSESDRKAYVLTAEGREYAESHTAELAAPWEAFRQQGPGSDLRPLLGQVAAAMWQVAAVGTTSQQEAAREAVIELRKRLYRILAEDDDSAVGPDPVADDQ